MLVAGTAIDAAVVFIPLLLLLLIELLLPLLLLLETDIIIIRNRYHYYHNQHHHHYHRSPSSRLLLAPSLSVTSWFRLIIGIRWPVWSLYLLPNARVIGEITFAVKLRIQTTSFIRS